MDDPLEEPDTPTTNEPAPPTAEVAALRHRAHGLGLFAVASLVAAVVLGGLLVRERRSEPEIELSGDRPGGPPPAQVERLLASLDDQPVDPTRVKLVSTVSTFADCDSLIGDLRRVGAEHVGSRGFGGYYDGGRYPFGVEERQGRTSDAAFDEVSASTDGAGRSGAGEGETLGTNVQVAGVDELDFVKAVGRLLFDLDEKGDLRITDTAAMKVLSRTDVTPPRPGPGAQTFASQLLVAGNRVAVFGTEYKVSEPVEGDPSATRATTEFMTVTFVDAGDPAAPRITDRVRIEGSLVSARLVEGEVRLVTTSNMADLGFVMPTTPTSIPKALEQNRRSVASSTAADWIPDWQRPDEDPVPLVPCERVHLPDTFSGVAMTSMVTFPLDARFEPAGTSVLAPASTLYSGLDKVAVSSEVWVDPADQQRLKFRERWQTAIHQFAFTPGAAPTYAGSGIVDGSTIGQFAFGEIGDSLAVVTTRGTPWNQDLKRGVDMTVLTPDGDGGLTETSKVADLAEGRGEVTAVRFVEGRVLISTGFAGRQVYVLDVSDPAAPRRAGHVTLPGTVGYFHPLPDQQALIVSSRSDEVGEGGREQYRSWVVAHLLDVSNPDTPGVVSTWERPWVSDNVGGDHHAFTYWPGRKLAMWGLSNTQWPTSEPANSAVVLGTDGALREVAVPAAAKPNEVPPPCPVVEITDPDLRASLGRDSVLLRCDDKELRELDWPRYECYRVDPSTVARYAPGEQDRAGFFVCSPAAWPTVARVLVVAGTPVLYTDQTLETLDPDTFQSTSVTYHRSSRGYGYY